MALAAVICLERMAPLRTLVVALALVAVAGPAGARGSQAVVIVRPEASTCIDADSLTAAMANAGAILPSVVPEEVARDAPAGSVVFRIDAAGPGLRIRGWGLSRETSPGGLVEWPSPWAEREPDVDREIAAPACETATEVVVAFLVSVLAPRGDEGAGAELQVLEGSKLASVLESASAELTGSPHLTAGVLHTELGLTFIVEDVHASCRRGTWLDLRSGEPRMGQTVAGLASDVQACLDARELAERQKGLRPGAASASSGERFGLPQVTGALVAALGVGVASAAALRYQNPTPVVLFAGVPAVAGGISGYLVPEPGQEALWLSGYWLAVAGGSLVASAQDSAGKPAVLVGGFITAGAAGSAALVMVDALRGDEVPLPAWAIGLPALSGAALSWVSLLTTGDSGNSADIAVFGSFAAIAPAFWIAMSPSPRADSGVSAASVGIAVTHAGALLELRGEL